MMFSHPIGADGASLIYSTFLGHQRDSGVGIAVDGSGTAYITGYTTSTDFSDSVSFSG